jgi:hypothetical protein
MPVEKVVFPAPPGCGGLQRRNSALPKIESQRLLSGTMG